MKCMRTGAVIKLLLIPCIFLLVSCGDSQKHLEAAKDFYTANYWMVTKPYEIAFQQVDETNASIINGATDKCMIDQAEKSNELLKEAKELMEKTKQNGALAIKDIASEHELEAANDYYKNTQLGKFISSEAGLNEMMKILSSAPDAESMTENIRATAEPEERFNLLINYILASLPKEEAEKYKAFRSLPIWKKEQKMADAVDKSLQPFLAKVQEVGQATDDAFKKCKPEPEEAPAKK